jgi:dihydrofolate reductase
VSVPDHALIGYAIVSDDDYIADSAGMPRALMNEADWAYFQAGLDRADLVLLGRIGHERHPNPRRRKRLVVSASVSGLEEREDGWWWNPAGLPLEAVLAALLPEGGTVAVTGGRRVFDLGLTEGYEAFHLSRAEEVRLGSGTPVFSGVAAGHSAEALLTEAGLAPVERRMLDASARVSLTVFRKQD